MIKTVLIRDTLYNDHFFLKSIHEYAPSIQVIGKVTDMHQGVSFILEEAPDLVFIDLASKADTSFQLLDRIRNHSFLLVFIADDDVHAMRAFAYGALDYLIRPFSLPHLIRCFDRIKQTLSREEVFEKLDALLQKHQIRNASHISLPTSEGVVVLAIAEISRIETHQANSIAHLENADKVFISKSIKEMESMLPQEIFVRIHTSHLINLNFVRQYTKADGGHLYLKDGSRIPIARRRKKAFFARLIQ